MVFRSQADIQLASQQDDLYAKSEFHFGRPLRSSRRHPADVVQSFPFPTQYVAHGMPIVAMGHVDCGECHCSDIPSLCMGYDTWTFPVITPWIDTYSQRYWANYGEDF